MSSARLRRERPVHDGEQHPACDEPEQPASRERRDLDEQQKAEQRGEGDLQAVPSLEPKVERRQHQQRDDEHDSEVICVPGQAVDPVDARLADRAPDVQGRRPTRDRVEDERVEIPPAEPRHDLEEAVRRVRREARCEPADRPPVEALRAAREVRDARGEEREVDQELRHPLPVERECLLRLEVEEAGQVHDQERRAEAEHGENRRRHETVAVADAARDEGDEEEERDDVREVHAPGDVPVDVLERDREDRREEEERRESVGEPHAESPQQVGELLRSGPARQPVLELVGEAAVLERALLPAGSETLDGGSQRSDVVRCDDDSGVGAAHELGGDPVGGHGGENRPLSREVLEDLPGRNRPSAPTRLREEQEERLRVALQLERRTTRHVRDLLDALAEPELVRELAIRRAQAADEARDDIVFGFRERRQKRTGIAVAEERAGVRDPELLPRVVLEAFEVVEVAAVRDRLDTLGAELSHLPRDRVRDRDDRVGVTRHELRDERLGLLFHPHREPVDPPVGVGRDRVAQVGDPRHAGRLLHRRADQVERRRRRSRDNDVDRLVANDAASRRDGSQPPADELVGDEEASGEERRLP